MGDAVGAGPDGLAEGGINRGDLRGHDHLDHAVGGDVGSDIEDDADLHPLDGGLGAKSAQGNAGGDRNLVADLNGRHLIVAGQDGGAGKDLDLPHFLDGAQGGGEIVPGNGIKAGAGEGVDAGRGGGALG